MQPFELHLVVDKPASALELLSANCKLSKNQLKVIMQKGAVWLGVGDKTKRLRRGKKLLFIGQHLHIYYNEKALSDSFPKPQIIEDCGEYSVWSKPRGMMTQGSKWGDHSTIARYAELVMVPQRPAFIVHRLDRATQGVIVVAHGKQAVQNLTAMFAERKVSKHYRAVVHGELKNKEVYTNPIDDRAAHSIATPISYDAGRNFSLLDIEIITGRKHQVRRHLSQAGFPIVGDRLYGESKDLEHDLQLCAYSLEFICPFNQHLKTYKAEPDLILGI